ncbi:glycosyltransferase family 4 protein [Acinetobacter sp. ANC 4277]|uniref:glycosyltransferase family 4 protein n=1 Tax=Acinetobacter terrae TaxID=2731247 RepID=UPI00148FA40F|nr:glycosyltransferase family 4 protein [Acinetobacter terrae]NNG75325.1 glycosyltransferase family 4 protein [Acinetobacter terrae]
MKKIFIVSEYILPNQNTTGYLFHKLHENLKKQYGERLHLIVKEEPNHLIEDAILVADVNLNKKKLVQRLIFELIISFRFLLKILFNVGKGDVVFTGTTPIFLLPIIYFAKKIKRFKWVLLIHDVFPENLVAAKVLKPSNIIYKGLKYLFDKFYSSADKRIVIGKDMKDLVDRKVANNDSIIIQNWIDHYDIEVQTKSENEIIHKLSWQNEKPIFNFFGNIGRVQGIHNIIEALELLSARQRPKILFIGGGAYEHELNSALNKLNDDNIKYIGPLDPLRKSDGLSACDIAIVTLAEGMYGLGVPSKAYYSMAADKPILAIMHEESEVSYMVKQHGIGWVVPAGNPQKLAEMLVKITDDFQNMKPISPRKVLIENYSEPVAMKKIIAVIDEIL